MQHADVCPHGYIRAHKAMVAAIVNEAVRAGADADLERYVPELMRQKVDGTIEDAKMDAVVSWPASGSRILVDASVRSAASSRYQRMGASEKCGVAGQAGDKEKMARYGQAVWPCVMESRGRLSQGGRAVLQRLVIDSRAYGKRPCAPEHCAHLWRWPSSGPSPIGRSERPIPRGSTAPARPWLGVKMLKHLPQAQHRQSADAVQKVRKAHRGPQSGVKRLQEGAKRRESRARVRQAKP